MSNLPINKHNYRLLEEQNLLFHVPSTSLFSLDEYQMNLLKNLESSSLKLDDETLNYLEKLKIIGAETEEKSKVLVEKHPATTIILNITSGCNLSCTYCYKEDLSTLKNSGNMDFQTAKKAINLLYENAPNEPFYTITYFGGEPLSKFSLIQEITKYAVSFFASKNAKVDFTLTTNATLINDEIIKFFKKYKFGITVSIDGPKAIHDKTRRTSLGHGTYEIVKKKALMLLSKYQQRPIGARVTLTAGVTDVGAIYEHLMYDLKFSEVGFAPATASDNALFNLSEKELIKVFDGFKELGEDYVKNAINNRFNGFSNLHRLLGDIHKGKKKSLPCGAGVGLLSVNYKGEFDLCHRFTGSSLKPFGNITLGLDKKSLSNFIEKRLNNHNLKCQKCHIRNLCAGGCYHESYVRYNDPTSANLHYCEIMQEWVDFGLNAYARIMSKNPNFLNKYFNTKEQGETDEI